MPAAIAAAAVTAIGLTGTAAAVTSAVISTVITVGASYAAQRLTRKPGAAPGATAVRPSGSALTASAAPANGARDVVTQQSVPDRRLAFGPVRVGGFLWFQRNENPYLYVGVGLSDGPIESVEGVFLGEQEIQLSNYGFDATRTPVSGDLYRDVIACEFGAGEPAQSRSDILKAVFPTTVSPTFRQRGVARAVFRLDWGDDATQHNLFWGTGITPIVSIQGVKCYDPREDSTVPGGSGAHRVDDAATWEYTTNPALCLARFLVSAWDRAVDPDVIDWPAIQAAADVCDAGGAPTYTLAGIVQASVPFADQVAQMLSAMGGALTLHDGLIAVHADAARAPVLTLTDDDMAIDGEVVFQRDAPKADAPNTIKAIYYAADGKGSQTPVIVDAAAVSADGETNEIVLELPFTPDGTSAQILAWRHMQKAREGRLLTIDVSDVGLFLRPFEVITISSVNMPAINGLYVVEETELTEAGAKLYLSGYSQNAYVDPATYLVEG